MKYLDRIDLFFWDKTDALMAWLIKRYGGIPPLTWKAICNEKWFFSHRYVASRKIGVRKIYNVRTEKFTCEVIE